MSNSKISWLIGGGVFLAVALLLKLIIYFSTGWTYEATTDYKVVRVAHSFWEAKYWDGEDSWSEPVSDTNTLAEIDGEITKEYKYPNVTMHEGAKYPTFKSQYAAIDQNYLNKIVKNVEQQFFVEGAHGDCEVSSAHTYYEFMQLKLGNKPCYVVYHHGKYWSYSTSN